MPRIPNLGAEMDWNFENIGGFPLIDGNSPVIVKDRHALSLNLLVVLDRPALPDCPFKGETALWHPRKRSWSEVSSDKRTPILPGRIQQLFVRLSEQLPAVQVKYSWDGKRHIGVYLSLAYGLERGNATIGTAPPIYSVGQALYIGHYAKFLDSLASKMGRWYSE